MADQVILELDELTKSLVKVEEACTVTVPGAFAKCSGFLGDIAGDNGFMKELINLWVEAEGTWNSKVSGMYTSISGNFNKVKGLTENIESYKAAEAVDISKREIDELPSDIDEC